MRTAIIWGLSAAAVVCLLVFGAYELLAHQQHWAAVHTGTYIPAGQYSEWYNFFSGFGSNLQAYLQLFIGVFVAVTLIKGLNCHEPGCARLGVHQTANGHRLCKKHVAMPNSELHLHEVHDDHKHPLNRTNGEASPPSSP